MPIDVLRDTIQPFPTFSEIYVEALKALRRRDRDGRGRGGLADAREPELPGQTVVVIGGSAGIGLETARRARAEGADVILTGRDPERLERAAREVGAREHRGVRRHRPGRASSGSSRTCRRRSTTCWSPAGGPYYAPLAEMDFAEARRDARRGTCCCRSTSPGTPPAGCGPAASLLFIGGTGGRRPGVGAGARSAR